MPHIFTSELLKWYRLNGRELPWRGETNPYRIWLSEIILQQTQVAQGMNYYHRFVETFPDVSSLAAATDDHVMKLWQGLGYYSRARNLHAAAKQIVDFYGGVFPVNYDKIRKLKGVGDYTAAAIASFAYNLPYAAIDGNAYRVLSRVFGENTPIDTTAGKKVFADLSSELLPRRRSAEYNSAMMDFGSQQCKPANPRCAECPLNQLCIAFKENTINALPVKSKKTAVKDRHLHFLVMSDSNRRIAVQKRTGSDIWKGLYQFHLVETKRPATPRQIIQSAVTEKAAGKNFVIKKVSREYRHQLTHQRLHARFYVLRIKRKLKPDDSTPVEKLRDLPFPKLISRFVEETDLESVL